MDAAAARRDATTEALVAFARAARYEALAPAVVHETRRRVIDAFASALGAWDEAAATLARAAAARVRGDEAARVWGSGIVTTPELAAFANGTMVRVLDVSDTYLGRSRGHPSDMLAGLIAVAESVHADGRALITAINLAYDVYCSFCRDIDLNAQGWDQPVYTVLGCALGAAKLLALDDAATGHAVSLALTPNVALAQARRGSLSSWKACAGANAARNAVFAALLARDGFTGPAAVFEGSGGLWEAIGRPDWRLPAAPLIADTHTKSLPVCYHGQAAVLAALELRGRVALAAIESIHVEGYAAAVFMMGSDPSRWAPATRETADHSLPYCVAVALVDGAVTRESFAAARLGDPALAALMRKVRVSEDAALSAQYPEGAPGRVTVYRRDAPPLAVEIRYPLGHARNPMDDAALERKFRDLCGGRLAPPRLDAALAVLQRLETLDDTACLSALFEPTPPAAAGRA